MAKSEVTGAPHDAGSAFESGSFRGLPGQVSGAILARRKRELDQRLSGLYRKVKTLPRCCEHCDFLTACTANRIACFTFARWAIGLKTKLPQEAMRIATPDVYDLVFSDEDIESVERTATRSAKVRAAKAKTIALYEELTHAPSDAA